MSKSDIEILEAALGYIETVRESNLGKELPNDFWKLEDAMEQLTEFLELRRT